MATTSAPTMRAAVLRAPGCISIEAVKKPEPGPEEIRVRIEGCGVCASNLPVWEGKPWFSYPFPPGALGHEAYGWVDQIGENVDRWKRGDRVAILSSHGYAEYDLAGASDAVALPQALDTMPFPGEPLACAINVFRRAAISADMTVAIVGIGFLGALLTQLTVGVGARVIALGRRDCALDLARAEGAAELISFDTRERVVARVSELTAGKYCDVVIEAVGKQEPLDVAGEITRERGRLVIAGYHQDGPRQINMQLWNWRGLDVINAHERDPAVYLEGMRDAMDAVIVRRLDPRPLITHFFPLDDLATALNMTRDRPDGFVKAVITMCGPR